MERGLNLLAFLPAISKQKQMRFYLADLLSFPFFDASVEVVENLEAQL